MFKRLTQNNFAYGNKDTAMVLLLFFFLLPVSHSQSAEPLTDPTRPAFNAKMTTELSEEQATGGYKISQIFVGTKTRTAIVNGQKVRRGDTVANAQVVAIQSDSVHLLIDGKIEVISIMPSIKQSVSND